MKVMLSYEEWKKLLENANLIPKGYRIVNLTRGSGLKSSLNIYVEKYTGKEEGKDGK